MLRRRPVVIANEIRLKRSQHQGTFLVVEGRDDRLFCERFIDSRACNIIVAESKESVYEVLKILEKTAFPGALGIVDSDFEQLEQPGQHRPNIVRPDGHDLETMLLQSPALGRLLVELGSREKIEALGHKVRDLLLTTALPIGYLRWYSRQSGLGLKFEGLNLSACVDSRRLAIDHQELVQQVKNNSQRPDLDSAELQRAIRELEHPDHDPWHVCSGEDLVGILSIGLRRTIGTNSAQAVRIEEIKRSLRLAYDEADFLVSHLAQAIRAWEERNTPFRVLT